MTARDAAPDIGQRQAADQRVVRPADDEEGIALVGAQVLAIAADAAPERAAGEIVGRPGRLPRREEIAAGFAQRRPLGEVGHLRRAQHDAVAGDRRRRFAEINGAEERHVG